MYDKNNIADYKLLKITGIKKMDNLFKIL